MCTKKDIPVFLLLLFISSWSYAQTDRSTIRFGGDFSFDYHEVTIEVPFFEDLERSTSTIMLQFRPGYFVVNQLIGGLDGGYTNFSNEGESFGQEFFIGGFAGYYIKSRSEFLYFPITVSVGYLSQKSEEELAGTVQELEFTGIYYSAAVGMEYISGKNLGLSLNFGPQIRNLEDNVGGFTVDQNLTSWQVRIGASYFITQ